MADKIIVRGAREHNLKNVSVELPRDKLIVFTGLSGSGKSSLAFDTIYAEGQRRYVESLSAYARQFLGQMDKPDVDHIEGLSPAISIDQKSASRNPRSTVGTITEVYDYLRLLYARIGVQHCPKDGTALKRQTPQQIVDRVLQMPDGTRFQVLAPVVRGRKGEYDTLLGELAGQGYVRARVDGELVDISEFLKQEKRLARYEQHSIEVVIDRLVKKDNISRRLTDSLETALRLAEGVAEIELMGVKGDESEILTFSQHLACPKCGDSFDEPAPRNFSFNSPYGACENCDGLGTKFEVDADLVIPNTDLAITESAIAPWRSAHTQYFNRMLESVAEKYKIPLTKPFAWHINVWQKVHFNFDCAVTRASLTAPTGDVETKASWLIPANLCFRGCSKQFTNIVEDTCVGSRVAARCTTNWRLIHINHFVKVLNAIDRLMTPWSIFRLVDLMQ